MTTQLDSILWVFGLHSRIFFYVYTNTVLCLAFLSVVVAFVVLNLVYWVHPGGAAWGRHMIWKENGNKPTARPIPGPRGFFILGSMNLMVGLAHHKIAAMATVCTAKRLMAFSLGETRVIVTCNPEVAKEILNNTHFADRPVKESAYNLMFNRAMGFAPYGVYWRTLRRIAATHLFSPKQINSSEYQRTEIANQIADMFRLEQGESIQIRDVLKRASLFTMMWSVFGREYRLDAKNGEAEEAERLVAEGYQALSVFNWSDHLPWLKEFDLQRVRWSCSKLVPRVNRFISRIIDEHRAEASELNRDFVDVLLNLRGSDKLADSDMIAVLWEMIFRGTDTVAILIEWIMARLVLHPDVQSRIHDELDRIVSGSRDVNESDLSEMVYLHAVVKEVLRLHPPGPLLSWARLSITDTMVDGHHIPKGTTSMVNMWAITRDPYVWADPHDFKPERFLSKHKTTTTEFSIWGSDMRLAPFGSGRRNCPGKIMGFTTVIYWVATLLQEFEFGPMKGDKNVDLSERLGLSCEMAIPLKVKVHSRRIFS